jgi:hypothetical protein
MKNSKSTLTRGLLLLAAVSILSWSTAGITVADDYHHDAWSHDGHGYWDDHNSYHAFIFHENHHGYWRHREDGTRVFINID